MKNTLLFTDILQGINAINARKKLSTIETECSARKLLLFNQVIDVVYISDNELLLVACDFLPASSHTKDWLADEAGFQNKVPCYFSEDSQRQSPVYRLWRAKKFFSQFFPQLHFHISSLLLCNYNIINYDDMEEQWKNLGVTVVHRMEDTSPLFQKEIAKKEDAPEENASEFSEDEFEQALEEFLQMEENIQDSEPLPTDIPDIECFIIHEIKMWRLSPGVEDAFEPDKLQPALKAFNVRDLDAIKVNIHGQYLFNLPPNGCFEFNLYNETGQLLAHEKLAASFIPNNNGMEISIRFTVSKNGSISWKRGKYLLEICFQDKTLATATFDVGSKDTEGSFLNKEEEEDELDRPFETLERMTGLRQVKEQMARYRNLIQLAQKRKAKALYTPLPPLHAAFMGSPGTGKTTVARLYGSMLKELGLLSRGHVIFEERGTLMGQNYASEQENTLAALEKAKGGILFIDEAYSLYKPDDPRDPGRNVLETLLTAMGDNTNHDWALLLAGYTDEMTALFSFNSGFASRIPLQNRYHFEDYTVDELMAIANSYCETNNYILTAEARKALRNKVAYDHCHRDRTFGNGRYIISLLSNEILQSMASRVSKIKHPTLIQLITIEKEDIPASRLKNDENPLKKLHNMVGLSHLKQSIESHLNRIKLSILRNEQGIHTALPSLHMAFTGNPGTGKTTVADLIGEVYASLELLSTGKVIHVERKDLVGTHISETEKKVIEVLKRAQGNVLFVDEAYTLYGSPADSEENGYSAWEMLLAALEENPTDMAIILAGYPEEIEKMFQSYPQLKLHVPYTFYFEDYTEDELVAIAQETVAKMNLCFTSSALKSLRLLVRDKLAHRTAHWGNAHFITRLITTLIVPAMNARLMQLPSHKLTDKKILSTICRGDIPTGDSHTLKLSNEGFDETAIRRTLKKLDDMVGLAQVKRNIHNFVDVARYLYQTERSYSDCGSLRWNFTGNTGTGKSTIAGIMGELLKAMNILEKGHLVEVKAEEIYNVSEYKADEILKSAMIRSRQGLLFIDGDAPLFRQPNSNFDSESLRFKLSSMMVELPGVYALIIAEHESYNHPLAQSLRMTGLPEFDHTFYFEDYTEDELCQILEQCLKKRKLSLSAEAGRHLSDYIHGLCSQRELGYANARTMKLIADAIAETCWLRASIEGDVAVSEVLQKDVESFVWKGALKEKRIGYK